MAPDGDVREWAPAARFISLEEAVAARIALDAAAIESYLSDDSADMLQLMVHGDDVERAREVIRAFAPSERVPAVCPECGSRDLRPIGRLRIFLLLALLLMGIGAAVDQGLIAATALLAVAAGVVLMPTHRCRGCGARFSPRESGRRWHVMLPLRNDLIEWPCSRCGSLEVHRVWWALRKWRCDSCGLIWARK